MGEHAGKRVRQHELHVDRHREAGGMASFVVARLKRCIRHSRRLAPRIGMFASLYVKGLISESRRSSPQDADIVGDVALDHVAKDDMSSTAVFMVEGQHLEHDDGAEEAYLNCINHMVLAVLGRTVHMPADATT